LGILISTIGYAQSTGYTQQGNGTWYETESQGMSASHAVLPFGTRLRVTNLDNNRQTIVTINNRIPSSNSRIIDISKAAAQNIDMASTGTTPVMIEVLGGARPSASTAETAPPPAEPTPALAELAPPPPPPVAEPAPEPAPAPPAPAPQPAPAASSEPANYQPASTNQIIITINGLGYHDGMVTTKDVITSNTPNVPEVSINMSPPNDYPGYDPYYYEEPCPPVYLEPVPQYVPVQPAPTYYYVPQPQPQIQVLPQAQPQYTYAVVPSPSRRVGSPPANIIPRIPDPRSGKLYRVQIGAYLYPSHAQQVIQRLQEVGLRPGYENYQDHYRVVIPRVRAVDVPALARELGAAGFTEALIREER
jgi:hypothetical protein